MFKWIVKWFDEEFPAIKEEPHVPYQSTELAVVEPVRKHELEESQFKFSNHELNELKKLREFLTQLESACLVGVHDHRDDGDAFDKFEFKYLNQSKYTFYSSDGTFFSFEYYKSYLSGTVYHCHLKIYKVSEAVVQGDLFEHDQILKNHKRINSLNLEICVLSDRHYYDKEENNKRKYQANVLKKACDHIKEKAKGLPSIELADCEVKPFHKNWEQLPLALDNGEEIFKICS